MVRPKNLLFVCEGNLERSPTFEIWFKKNRPLYDVRSAGTSVYSDRRLTKELLEWADVVYVMDLEQEMFIDRKFPEFVCKVTVIGCNDVYQREGNRLFGLIEYWVKKVNL